MDFKYQLFNKLWKEKDKIKLEQWIYSTNSIEFENLVGEKSYLNIISENYSKLTIKQLKQIIFDNISHSLKTEYKKYIVANQKVIKAKCIKTKAFDYWGENERQKNINTDKDFLLYKKIDNILWFDWDPIGINDLAPRDEYQNYVSEIYGLVKVNSDVHEIANRLHKLETENMGMKGSIENCLIIANKILLE